MPSVRLCKHSVRREFEQGAAVEKRSDGDALRKDALVQLLHLRVNAIEDLVGVFAFLEEDDALDHIVIVDELAIMTTIGLADLAEPDLRALAGP